MTQEITAWNITSTDKLTRPSDGFYLTDPDGHVTAYIKPDGSAYFSSATIKGAGPTATLNARPPLTQQELDHLQTLRQRRDYLSARIKAKESVGWETKYDRRERDLLSWAVERLEVKDGGDSNCIVSADLTGDSDHLHSASV